MQYDCLFKIIIIGNSGSGKSSILNQYSDKTFDERHCSTIGVDFKIKTLSINNTNIKLQIWDTAGQERFATITTAYYRGAHGIFLVYDVTDRDSFDNLPKWVDDIRKFAAPNPKIYILANKVDLDLNRKITEKEGRLFAENMGAEYSEISAKENINIDTCFNSIAENLLEAYKKKYNKQYNKHQSSPIITLEPQIITPNQTCC